MMPNRRVILLILLVAFSAGFGVACVGGQGQPRMSADIILRLVTDEIPHRADVRVHIDHWDPGAETGHHEHPGPVVFVMLDGELEEILASGETRVLKAGQAFWKRPRTPHNVRNVSDRPARALALHLDPAP
jgi:mannose-6-phosphate isomerase-like protein (cupin superfamily)